MSRPVTAVSAAVLALTVTACTSSTARPTSPRTSTHTHGRSTGTGTVARTAPSTPSSVSTAAPTVSTAAPSARTVTILGSGDVLIHPPVWQQAHIDARAAGRSGYDFAPILADIAPDVRPADVATCELETPLAPPGGPFVGYPSFAAPPQVLTALRGVGYTSCTTASNHSLDGGTAGITRTLNELDAAGLRHTGSARSAAAAARPLIVRLPNGVHVGQLAYTFGFNGNSLPAGRSWAANRTDIPTILAAAARMKRAGADIVVLSMHWGTEYDHLATSVQRAQARRLLASPDIDLILGDHAHVIQPAEKIHGKWVFYCMGDQVSRHADAIADNREGIMATVTFTAAGPHTFRATSARAVPTWVELSPALRIVDLPRDLARPDLSTADRATYATARTQITRYVDAYGARRDGLTVP